MALAAALQPSAAPHRDVITAVGPASAPPRGLASRRVTASDAEVQPVEPTSTAVQPVEPVAKGAPGAAGDARRMDAPPAGLPGVRLGRAADRRAVAPPRHRFAAFPRQTGSRASGALARTAGRQRGEHPRGWPRPRPQTPRRSQGPGGEAAGREGRCGIVRRAAGGSEARGVETGWRPLSVAARLRWHLRVDAAGRVRPHHSARIGRVLEARERPAALPVPQRSRREAVVRRRVDEPVHAATPPDRPGQPGS